EDGIRDFHVTGVQTCALPITERASPSGTMIDSTAASRKSLHRPFITSVNRTPARLTTSPLDVDRNAAAAPAATSPPSSHPAQFCPSTAVGTSSTAASVSPLTSSWGV